MAAEAVLKIAEHSQQIFFPGDDGPAKTPGIEPWLNALLSLLRRRLLLATFLGLRAFRRLEP